MTSVSTLQFPEPFFRYLKQHMTEDHQKLDDMLEAVASLVRRRDFFKAAALGQFGGFRARQEQHMAAEESITFPLLESLSPGSALLAELRAEHAVIRQAIEALAKALSSENREQFDRAYAELCAALKVHNQHENELLEGTLQPVTGADRELLLKIARLPFA